MSYNKLTFRIANLPPECLLYSKQSPSEYLLYSKPSPRILYYIVNITVGGNLLYSKHPPIHSRSVSTVIVCAITIYIIMLYLALIMRKYVPGWKTQCTTRSGVHCFFHAGHSFPWSMLSTTLILLLYWQFTIFFGNWYTISEYIIFYYAKGFKQPYLYIK